MFCPPFYLFYFYVCVSHYATQNLSPYSSCSYAGGGMAPGHTQFLHNLWHITYIIQPIIGGGHKVISLFNETAFFFNHPQSVFFHILFFMLRNTGKWWIKCCLGWNQVECWSQWMDWEVSPQPGLANQITLLTGVGKESLCINRESARLLAF